MYYRVLGIICVYNLLLHFSSVKELLFHFIIVTRLCYFLYKNAHKQESGPTLCICFLYNQSLYQWYPCKYTIMTGHIHGTNVKLIK